MHLIYRNLMNIYIWIYKYIFHCKNLIYIIRCIGEDRNIIERYIYEMDKYKQNVIFNYEYVDIILISSI